MVRPAFTTISRTVSAVSPTNTPTFSTLSGNFSHNFPRCLNRNLPRTLLIKHKPHRIRPGLNRGQRILQIRHPTNLHPGHTHNCLQKVKTFAQNPLTARSGLATRYWPLKPAALLPAAPPASATPQSRTPDTPPPAAAQYPLPTESRSPPPAPHSSEALRQPKRRPRIHLERPQIRACSLQSDRTRHPAPAAILPHHAPHTEHPARVIPRPAPACSILRLRQSRHNQQHRIGRIRPRLQQLKFVHNKIFAQTRNFHRRRSHPQILQRPLKKLLHPSTQKAPPPPPPPIPAPTPPRKTPPGSIPSMATPSSTPQSPPRQPAFFLQRPPKPARHVLFRPLPQLPQIRRSFSLKDFAASRFGQSGQEKQAYRVPELYGKEWSVKGVIGQSEGDHGRRSRSPYKASPRVPDT